MILTSLQCYGQGFLNFPYVSPYLLAVCNIGVYLWVSFDSVGRLLADARRDMPLCVEEEQRVG